MTTSTRRRVAVALWLAFAGLALTVLWSPDPVGVIISTGWVVMSLGEAVAIWRVERGDTISDKTTAWVWRRWWRPVLLGVVMLFLFVHWLTGRP